MWVIIGMAFKVEDLLAVWQHMVLCGTRVPGHAGPSIRYAFNCTEEEGA